MNRRGNRVPFNRIIKTNLKYQTKEFFNNSTLHGVRYIAEEGRSFSEKFMWFCFVTIGAVSAIVIIASLWEKFQTNPTITGLDTDFHLHSLEFPSVILCPENPYNETIVNEYAKDNLGGNDVNYEVNIPLLKALTILSYDNMKQAAAFASKLSNETEQNWNKYKLRSLVFDVSKKCEDLFTECKFGGENKSCCELFKPIYSERGFCYSFNQRFYGTELTEEPLGQFSVINETGTSWSLELSLKEKSNFYLHSVMEVFGYDNRIQFTWEPDATIDILISMKQTYTTEDAQQLTVTQRKCIFPELSEQEINYYKDENYSISACMKECRMDNAINYCQCIPPFYAPYYSKGKKSECKLRDFQCLAKHMSDIINIRKCRKCELSCLTTVYDIEKASQTHGTEIEKTRSVNIEFLTWPIIRYKREVLFGWIDLLVSFGGIAGLFLGFSLLSGMEIIYFFSIRASCMFYKNRQQLYEAQADEESRPLEKYDLSMSFSRIGRISNGSNIRVVQPVESVEKEPYPSNDNREMKMATRGGGMLQREILNRERNKRRGNGFIFNDEMEGNISTQIITQRQPLQSNVKFRSISIAPYSENIKPLDRNYRRLGSNQEDPDLIYHGFLP